MGTATIEVNSIWERCNNAGCISQSLGIIGSKLHYQRAILWKYLNFYYSNQLLNISCVNVRFKRILQRGNSRWLVVNSLSLALVDRMKSEATIIGVKHKSQLYFLTKDLNASLLQREWQLSKDVITVFGKGNDACYHSYAFGICTFMIRAIQLTLNIGPLEHIFLGLCLFQTDPLYLRLCQCNFIRHSQYIVPVSIIC